MTSNQVNSKYLIMILSQINLKGKIPIFLDSEQIIHVEKTSSFDVSVKFDIDICKENIESKKSVFLDSARGLGER